MFYILYGQDDFSLQQALEKIKVDLGNTETLSINTFILDGQRLSLNELKDKCNSAPFLSSYRLVVVKGLLDRFEPRQSKSQLRRKDARFRDELGEWGALSSYLERLSEATVLVLRDGKISDRNPLLKELSPLAKMKAFPLLHGKSLKAWIQQHVAKDGGDITPDAVSLLAELVGGNLWAMSNEIHKLVLYAQGRPINEYDVRQLVSYAREADIFALVDAVLEGRIKVASRVLYQLYQDGASPTYILAMITRQFRLIALARDLGLGLSRRELQDKLGLPSSYALDKTLSQARFYDFEHVRRAYNKLLETDLAIKTGKHSDQLALELLVSDLC